MLRKVFWLIASAILLLAAVAAFFIIQSAYGDRQWDAYARVARLRGVKLTLPEVLPPWPPDEENFGTAPLFNDLMNGDASATAANQRFQLPDARSSDEALRPSIENCRQIDLRVWRQNFVRAGWLADDNKLSDARGILRALEKFDPELAMLREAAERRRCRFPVDWSVPLNAPMPHIGIIRKACEVLSLRDEALLADGRTSDVLADLRLLLRLSQRMEMEPGIFSSLAYEAPLRTACHLVWSGICRSAWDANALSTIESELETFDVLGHLRWSLESDRALQNETYDVIAKSKVFEGLDLVNDGKAVNRAVSQLFSRLYQRASLQQNRIRTNCYVDDLLNQFDENRGLFRLATSEWAPTDLSTSKPSRLKLLQFSVSDSLDGSYPSVLGHALRLHTLIQQARIACALERYRLSQERYPDELSALVPDYLPEIPHDVCDGAPMRYRIDPFRRYVIHAIGTDQKDDGGEPHASKTAQKPDWVWTYPPR